MVAVWAVAYAAVLADPPPETPQCYYVADQAKGILQYVLTHGASPLDPPEEPNAIGEGDDSFVVDPAGPYLYVLDRARYVIYAYHRAADGRLSALSPYRVSCGFKPTGIAIDPKGRFLVASQKADNFEMNPGTLRLFPIGADGALSMPEPDIWCDHKPGTVVFDPAGRFMVVCDGDHFSVYDVSADGSVLTKWPVSVLPNDGPGSGLGIDRAGAILVSNPGGRVATYRLGADKTVTPAATWSPGDAYTVTDVVVGSDKPVVYALCIPSHTSGNNWTEDIYSLQLKNDGSLARLADLQIPGARWPRIKASSMGDCLYGRTDNVGGDFIRIPILADGTLAPPLDYGSLPGADFAVAGPGSGRYTPAAPPVLSVPPSISYILSKDGHLFTFRGEKDGALTQIATTNLKARFTAMAISADRNTMIFAGSYRFGWLKLGTDGIPIESSIVITDEGLGFVNEPCLLNHV